MKKKKILYMTTISSMINAFLVPHIEMLIKEGYQVDVACQVNKKLDERLIKKGVRVHDISLSRQPLSIKNIKAFRQLLKIQDKNQYEIIHVHSPVASVIGRMLKIKYKNVKTIYTAHGYHFSKDTSKASWLIYYPIEKIMSNFTDVLITMNSEDYEITNLKFNPKKCYNIKGGVGLDLTKYKPLESKTIENKKIELGLKEDDFIMIMIAELHQRKNHMQLIKAMEIVTQKYKNIKVLCIGEGNREVRLKEEIKIRNLENNIKFLGFRTDVNELINIADVGILLSYREGLPRNVLELMANGKRVIATDIKGNRDLIYNNNFGTLVKVDDYKQTANVIEAYYTEKQIGKEVAITYHGEQRVRTVDQLAEYEVNSVCQDLKKIYNEIL